MSTSTQVIIFGGILFWLLTCVAILDIARKNFGDIKDKAIWGFTAMVPFIGPIIYFTIGYKKGTPKSQINPEEPASK